MRIMLALPPHSYATADVARAYVAALGRVPGVAVEAWHFWPRIMYHDGAVKSWGAKQRRSARLAGDVEPRIERQAGRNLVLLKASSEIVPDALHFRADWVVVVCGIAFHADTVRTLQQAGIRVAGVFTECPYEDQAAQTFGRYVDLLGVNDRASVGRFTPENTIYLPTAYDRDTHHPGVAPTEDEPDVLFLGTGFKERIALMAAVDWAGIDLRLRGHWSKASRNPALLPYLAADNGISITRNDISATMYRAARVNLNLYRRDGAAESMSPRAYELAALGAFALHEDVRIEAHEVLGDSVGYFDGSRGLGDAVRHYLTAPGTRARMAREAWERIQGHDYDARAATLLAAMERLTRHNRVA